MNNNLVSPYWYKIASLKPRLRGHAEIHRHNYRGNIWYVLQDHMSARMYRFTPPAYQIIGRMNGQKTIHELWEQCIELYGDDCPTQSEMIQLFNQLHNADALICDLPPDTEEIVKRGDRIRSFQRKKTLYNPIAIRIPLLDPDHFLTKTAPFVKPLFSWLGILLWCFTVGYALYLGFNHWGALTNNMIDHVLSANNILIIGLIFPLVKAVHELGHGYSVKQWGGEVHEVGIMLLVFLPIPYVDATSSTAFRSKWKRSVVGAAGIIAELFLAAIAMILWVYLEEGIIKAMAYNIVLIASVSTLFFNANPLLRYDGYYILSDVIEIPNLAQRSLQYLGYLWNRYIFGLKQNVSAISYLSLRERCWLASYAVVSFLYRTLVYFGIVLFISSKFFTLGIVLALLACYSMFVLPIFKKLHFIFFSPMLNQNRIRAVSTSTILMALIAGFLFYFPFPFFSRAQGVVWVPENAYIRAKENGTVEQIIKPSGSIVKKGDMLVSCSDVFLIKNKTVLEAQLQQLQAEYEAVLQDDQFQSQLMEEKMKTISAQLQYVVNQINNLTIISQVDGVFIVPNAQDLPGHFLQKGQLIGYVLDIIKPTIRVVVPQSIADLVRRQTINTDVKFIGHIEDSYPAEIKQEIPGALDFLPSTVLGSAGGGEIPIDPWDRQGVKAFNKLFQFDIELLQPVDQVKVGGRVLVRFYHGKEPLASQWYRSIRQLFLKRFNV